MYVHPLNVCSPEGKRVDAKITQMGSLCKIEIDFLEVVKKDNPPFAKDGVISFESDSTKHQEIIFKLEKYLEDLFLKGMADEDLHRSLRIESKSRRDKAARLSRKARSSKRKGNTPSVHFGARGGEQTESDRPRDSNIEVAESSDKDLGE